MKFESAEKVRAIGELWILAESNGKVAGKRDIVFVVESADGKSRREIDTSFFGPAP